ncbi:hypothetical protein BFR75_08580 [Acinetobacter pittii]|uniref:hypothetical protein n=1 Tax=Acinetobacter pittii TaxID=48296 RepID=UPI000838A2B0|nr:hypothetical protein [Acinetobacter pittii]OCY31907.1 hypothetical protein BFR75_08580 [Acinetobacter pittii]
MTEKVDLYSKFISQGLDVLFAKYPTRTGLGIVLGCALSFIINLFRPFLEKIESVDFNAAPWWGWLPIGLIIMHIPTIISVFHQNSIGNDTIDQALELIEKGNFSKMERRQHFRNLIEKVSSNIALSQNTSRELQKIEKELQRNSENQE